MNDEKKSNEQAYIKYLLSNIRCPVCHHRYSPHDILDFDHRNSLWLVALSCPECETKGLVFAIIDKKQEQTESFTELTAGEIDLFEEREAITSNDVLDFHEFLKDYSGDIAELVGW
ncbi:MAG: hypothetical protein B6I34_01935 [Anaerolineaceae bacterium 4572_32.1]|nr:MAG: hypothetical protein B6I34_01935 [Anaerolineaceae bacterium 4572_32.1]